LVEKYGNVIEGPERAELEQAFGDYIIKYKNAAELGALQAPDLKIVELASKASTGAKVLSSELFTGGAEGTVRGLNQAREGLKRDATIPIDSLRGAYGDHPSVKRLEEKIGAARGKTKVAEGGKDAEAIAWAKANKGDIRAQEILKLHGVQP
jgi:hypothetical protein